MMKIDREKYIKILKSQGLSAALTALHRDTEKLEFEAFEGKAGYQPELVEYLEGVREFSRDLWRTDIT